MWQKVGGGLRSLKALEFENWGDSSLAALEKFTPMAAGVRFNSAAFIVCTPRNDQMARPKSRAETVLFSRKAVIGLDGDRTLCLSFRVGDFRSSQLIGVRINALLVQRHRVGGHVRLHQVL